MGRRTVIWTIVAVVVVTLSGAAQAAPGGPLSSLLPGYPSWPPESSVGADSPWHPVSLVTSFIHHVFLRPTILPHLPMEPGRAITVAPGRELDAAGLGRVQGVLRRRLDNLVITEAMISIRGHELVIWIPGSVSMDSMLLEKALVADVDLRFQLVEEEGAISERVFSWLPEYVKEKGEEANQIGVNQGYGGQLLKAPRRDLLEAYVDWITPRISMTPSFAIGTQTRLEGAAPEYLLYVLDGEPWLTGTDVAEAVVGSNEWGEAYVSVNFTASGGQRFGELSGQSVERKLAIIVDGEVVSAPVIKEQINGGRAQITLGRGKPEEMLAEARSLAARLSSGYLGVDLAVSSVEIVGRTTASKLIVLGWWLLPTVPGLPAFHSQLHALLFASRK